MKKTYLDLRTQARQILEHLPAPPFQSAFALELEHSRKLFYSDPLLTALFRYMTGEIEDDFGHGKRHATLVGLDAGAIVQAEIHNWPESLQGLHDRDTCIRLVQAAAILHDIRRKEPNHSKQGALSAAALLSQKPFSLAQKDIDIICDAIENHEAFTVQTTQERTPGNRLISDALYDADKFRWGPDNFTHTVWDMVIYANMPLDEFIRKYPSGMQKLTQIKTTFRTATGKQYGPGIIDLGIETGNRLFKVIQKQYPDYF